MDISISPRPQVKEHSLSEWILVSNNTTFSQKETVSLMPFLFFEKNKKNAKCFQKKTIFAGLIYDDFQHLN